MSEQTRAGRRQFLLLAALFVAPIAAAWLLYFVAPQWQPKSRSNHGELIEPVRAVPDFALADAAGRTAPEALRGKWTLLYLGGVDCARSCQDKLLQTRQVRLLLNQERERVQRVYLAPDAAALAAARAALSPEAHGDLVFVAPSKMPAAPRDFFQPADADVIYVIDPLGNWLMRYAADADYKGMLKDLKRLLQLSHIG